MWANAKMARALRYPIERASRPGYILDIQDTQIWRTKEAHFGETQENRDKSIYNVAIAMSGDAAKFRGASLTPILIKTVSTAPWVRDRPAQIALTILLPKGVKWQGCLAPLWWELKQWGADGPGFDVYDAYSRVHAKCKLWLAFSQVTNDIRIHVYVYGIYANLIRIPLTFLPYSMTQEDCRSTRANARARVSWGGVCGAMSLAGNCPGVRPQPTLRPWSDCRHRTLLVTHIATRSAARANALSTPG